MTDSLTGEPGCRGWSRNIVQRRLYEVIADYAPQKPRRNINRNALQEQTEERHCYDLLTMIWSEGWSSDRPPNHLSVYILVVLTFWFQITRSRNALGARSVTAPLKRCYV